jgi:hypothetical protein
MPSFLLAGGGVLLEDDDEEERDDEEDEDEDVRVSSFLFLLAMVECSRVDVVVGDDDLCVVHDLC